jgi:hypothetical protein
MSELRTRAILVRLTPAEFKELERRARAAGRRPALYLREAALTDAAPALLANPDTVALTHLLTRIGTDLRIVAQSPGNDATRARADEVLAELLATLRQLASSDSRR